MTPKRESSPSESQPAKKARRVRKPFVAPSGWEETEGYKTISVHTAKCDRPGCRRHVTDDNPVKQCQCGANICWLCEQARGSLDHGCIFEGMDLSLLRQDLSSSRDEQQPAATSQENQSAIPAEIQTMLSNADIAQIQPAMAQPASTIGLDEQESALALTSELTARSDPSSLSKHINRESQDSLELQTHNEPPALAEVKQLAGPQTALAQDTFPDLEEFAGPEALDEPQPATVQTKCDPAQSVETESPPAISVIDEGQSSRSRYQTGSKSPLAGKRELTSPCRRRVVEDAIPSGLDSQTVNVREESPSGSMIWPPHIRRGQDILALEQITKSLADEPETTSVIGLYILRCLGKLSVAHGIANATGSCEDGLTGHIPPKYRVAASNLKDLVGPNSATEIANAVMERVRWIRSQPRRRSN